MRRAPLYTATTFSLTYDNYPAPIPDEDKPHEGEYVVTHTQRAFWIQRVRESTRIPNRFNLGVLRWPPEEIPADARIIHTIPSARKRKLRSKPKLRDAPKC